MLNCQRVYQYVYQHFRAKTWQSGNKTSSSDIPENEVPLQVGKKSGILHLDYGNSFSGISLIEIFSLQSIA